MPIIGLTDEKSINPAYRMIGKLRKGGERPKGGKQPGPELDHWRFTSDAPEIVKAFTAAYGKEPKEVEIFFPHTDPDAAFSTWCEIWKATALVHRCDGENMSIWLVGDHYEKGVKPCDGGHTKGEAMNDVVGRLEFILPGLVKAGYVGVVIMETHSRHDLMQITKTLRKVADDRRSPEGVRGVPFMLARIPREIGVPGFGDQAGQRSRVTKHLAVLTPSANWVAANMAAALAAGENHSAPQLTAPRPLLDEDDIIDVDPVTGDDEELPLLMQDWVRKELKTAELMPVEEKGQLLWPDGLWEGTVRSLSVKTLKGGEAGLDAFLIKKYKALINEYASGPVAPGILIAHIEKAWGFGDLYHELVTACGMVPNPLNVINGAAFLAAAIAKDATIKDNQTTMISVMMSQIMELEDMKTEEPTK